MHSHLTLRLDRPLQELLTMQTRGKLRRTLKKLSSPRRAIPTLLVATLLGMYAIKVYIAMTFYDSPTEFPVEGLAPIGMLYILLLKLLGVCINREKSGAGYRREELHHLVGGPFRLEQVRLYRVTGHAISIFFTSLFAAVFFVFHVKSFVAAVSGAYLAMLFTYLVYTVIAIVAYQVAEKTYRRLRMLGCGAAGAMMAWLIYRVSERGVSNLEFLQAFGDEAIQFSLLPGVSAVMSPFFVFTKVIVAESISGWLFWTVPALALNYVALQVLLYVEALFNRNAEQRERAEFCRALGTHKLPSQTSIQDLGKQFDTVPWIGGVGPIVWRQLKGVLRLKAGLCWLLFPLATALAAGAYLAYDPEAGAFQTVAVIVVTTSVFLPGLLPFDFRGDLNGLPALKMMPVRPMAVVFGQLLVPVFVLTAFQLVSLSTILIHNLEHWQLVSGTILFLIPTNFVILALENTIFLLYPYKLAEFDMQATVRRVVMLMAKLSVVFVAMVVMMLTAFGVVWLKTVIHETSIGHTLANAWQPLLIAIELVALFSLAWGVVWSTGLAYRRFDLSEDLPV